MGAELVDCDWQSISVKLSIASGQTVVASRWLLVAENRQFCDVRDVSALLPALSGNASAQSQPRDKT